MSGLVNKGTPKIKTFPNHIHLGHLPEDHITPVDPYPEHLENLILRGRSQVDQPKGPSIWSTIWDLLMGGLVRFYQDYPGSYPFL